jgi:hypothetical protein
MHQVSTKWRCGRLTVLSAYLCTISLSPQFTTSSVSSKPSHLLFSWRVKKQELACYLSTNFNIQCGKIIPISILRRVNKLSGHAIAQAVSTTQLRPGFTPRAVRMGFVVKKVALGQVFFELFCFPPWISFHCCSAFTYVSSGGWTMDPLAAAVPQRHSLTSSRKW